MYTNEPIKTLKMKSYHEWSKRLWLEWKLNKILTKCQSKEKVALVLTCIQP